MKIATDFQYTLSDSCPYCYGNFVVEGKGEIKVTALYEVDIYTCIECQEIFEVHYDEGKMVSFFFSCNGIYVRCMYKEEITLGYPGVYHTSTNDKLQFSKMGLTAPTVQIPPFILDFSDKEKLFNKLKTYLIFS